MIGSQRHWRRGVIGAVGVAALAFFCSRVTAGEPPQRPPLVTRVDTKAGDHELSTAEIFIAIGTIWLAAATTLLWIATYKLHSGAERAASTAADQMRQQIDAAIASNAATRAVADATTNNALQLSEMMAKQFRAYMSVDFGRVFYQDERVYFGAEAVLRNRGLSPAYNVSFWVEARVMRLDAIDLSRPAGVSVVQNDVTMTPTQEFVIGDRVDHRFGEQDVIEILEGAKQRLFLWGELVYDDVYGKPHVTKFCHNYFFSKVDDPKEGADLYTHTSHLHRTHNTAT